MCEEAAQWKKAERYRSFVALSPIEIWEVSISSHSLSLSFFLLHPSNALLPSNRHQRQRHELGRRGESSHFIQFFFLLPHGTIPTFHACQHVIVAVRKRTFLAYFFVPHPALLSRRIQLLRGLCSASWMKSTSSNRFPTDHSHFFSSSHFHFTNMAKKRREARKRLKNHKNAISIN